MPPAMRNPERTPTKRAPRKVSVAEEAGLVKASKIYPLPLMQEAYERTVEKLGYEPDFPSSWKE